MAFKKYNELNWWLDKMQDTSIQRITPKLMLIRSIDLSSHFLFILVPRDVVEDFFMSYRSFWKFMKDFGKLQKYLYDYGSIQKIVEVFLKTLKVFEKLWKTCWTLKKLLKSYEKISKVLKLYLWKTTW